MNFSSGSRVSRRALFGWGVLRAVAQPVPPIRLSGYAVSALALEWISASTKPGSVRESMLIEGNGRVRLRAGAREMSGEARPETVERLAAHLVRQGWETWAAVYGEAHPHGVSRVFRVSAGGTTLRVVEVRGEPFAAYARAEGAALLVAAEACPKAFSGGFFTRLR